MKKKFTERQIDSFKKMIDNGIIEQLSDCPTLLRKIVSDLKDVDEGEIIYGEMTTSGIVNEYDARGETGHLVYELIDSISDRDRKRFVNRLAKDYDTYIDGEVDRKTMIELLGLRDFATKEDILKELNEIL